MHEVRKKWLKCVAWLLGIGGVVAVLEACGVHWASFTPERIRVYVLSFGWWAPIIYILIYGQPIVPLPASVMLMAAGLSFGMVGGLALALLAMTIRGYGQFWMARWCGREAIETLLRGRLATWDHEVGRMSFPTLLGIRLLAPVPYDIQNFSLGLSSISFGSFALATFLAAIPGGALWVYLGESVTTMRQLWKVAAVVGGLTTIWLVQRFRHRRVRAPS